MEYSNRMIKAFFLFVFQQEEVDLHVDSVLSYHPAYFVSGLLLFGINTTNKGKKHIVGAKMSYTS
jgi:hypothetical protein